MLSYSGRGLRVKGATNGVGSYQMLRAVRSMSQFDFSGDGGYDPTGGLGDIPGLDSGYTPDPSTDWGYLVDGNPAAGLSGGSGELLGPSLSELAGYTQNDYLGPAASDAGSSDGSSILGDILSGAQTAEGYLSTAISLDPTGLLKGTLGGLFGTGSSGTTQTGTGSGASGAHPTASTGGSASSGLGLGILAIGALFLMGGKK